MHPAGTPLVAVILCVGVAIADVSVPRGGALDSDRMRIRVPTGLGGNDEHDMPSLVHLLVLPTTPTEQVAAQRFTSGVFVARVTVVVTNGDGAPVADLHRRDFDVRVGNRSQLVVALHQADEQSSSPMLQHLARVGRPMAMILLTPGFPVVSLGGYADMRGSVGTENLDEMRNAIKLARAGGIAVSVIDPTPSVARSDSFDDLGRWHARPVAPRVAARHSKTSTLAPSPPPRPVTSSATKSRIRRSATVQQKFVSAGRGFVFGRWRHRIAPRLRQRASFPHRCRARCARRQPRATTEHVRTVVRVDSASGQHVFESHPAVALTSEAPRRR